MGLRQTLVGGFLEPRGSHGIVALDAVARIVHVADLILGLWQVLVGGLLVQGHRISEPPLRFGLEGVIKIIRCLSANDRRGNLRDRRDHYSVGAGGRGSHHSVRVGHRGGRRGDDGVRLGRLHDDRRLGLGAAAR